MDLLGVGIGPSNLSLAALLSTIKGVQSRFFDKQQTFSWHPGLMLPGAEIQVSHLKDLVTLVDPTNPYSFIAYLAKHKRLYRFIRCDFKYVLRQEFNDYMQWVSANLEYLHFNENVLDIEFNKNQFVTHTNKNRYTSTHIVLGSGLPEFIPLCAKKYLGPHVFHSSQYLHLSRQFKDKRLAIIGGGQSAAEIMLHLISDDTTLPRTINWVTTRSNILPMDDSAFSSEVYSPGYARHFYTLPKEKRNRSLQEQVLSSDGVSQHLIAAIYQRLYLLENLQHSPLQFNLMPNLKLLNMKHIHLDYELILSENNILAADIVILCTGYQWTFPRYLCSLQDRIPMENNRFLVNADYSIQWEGPRTHRIYVQNAATHSYGIADRNLSLTAWRSANIINSIAGQTIYNIEDENAAIAWHHAEAAKDNDWKEVCNA